MADSRSVCPPAEPTPARRHRSELTSREILNAIRRWHDLYGEPPGMMDWDPYRARQAGLDCRLLVTFIDADTELVMSHSLPPELIEEQARRVRAGIFKTSSVAVRAFAD